MIGTAKVRFGRVDILGNNAGTSMPKAFEEVSDDDWESDLELKVRGAHCRIRCPKLYWRAFG